MTTQTSHATGTFEVKTWDEKTWEGRPWKEVPGAKLTHAIVTKSYHGDIEGEGTSQSLTAYADDGSASYVGLERVVGSLGGHPGSFVLQYSGTYDPGAGEARTTWFVAPGSGTGDLRGLWGEGGFVAKHGESANVPLTLDYHFD